jgi:WD40 repeat protein
MIVAAEVSLSLWSPSSRSASLIRPCEPKVPVLRCRDRRSRRPDRSSRRALSHPLRTRSLSDLNHSNTLLTSVEDWPLLLGLRETKPRLVGPRRALTVGVAASLVAASLSLADRQLTIARAREVVNGRQASGGSDGGVLAVAGRDRAVLFRQAHSPSQVVATLDGHAGPVSSVAFGPTGRILATATENGTVQLWDVQSNTLLGTLKGLTGVVDSVAFSPDGRTVAAAGRDGTVVLWNVSSQAESGTALKAHAGSVYSVAFSRDGGTLAAASANGTVVLWDLRHHTRLGTLNNHAGAIGSVAFRPDGLSLAAADIDGTIVLWDVRSLHPLGKPLLTHHLVSGVAFSPNGRTLAAANGDNGTVALLGVQSHHLIATLRTGNRGPVNSVAFSPGGHTLATGSENGTVQLWDTRSRALLKTLSAGPGQVFSVAFSREGRFLGAAGFTGTIRVWQKGVLWRN